jgi:histidine triad (HIT) family protein
VESCIFCRIISGELKTNKFAENETILVIHDRIPRAPTHLLIMPKIHLPNMGVLTPDNAHLMSDMGLMVAKLAQKYPNFNIIVNNGAEAGQSVFHLHWHFIAGRNIYSDAFSL